MTRWFGKVRPCLGTVRLTVGGSWRLLVVPCRVEATREGDGERVQCRLPPVHPSFLGGAGRVKGTRHEVQTLQRGLIGREVTTGPHSPPETGVQRLDRVRGADDAADLDVVGEEGDELLPG